MVHLDECVGLPVSHPASFRKYLLERLIRKMGITKYHFLRGDGNVFEVARSVGAELTAASVDIAFVGVGERLVLESYLNPHGKRVCLYNGPQ